MESLGIRGQIHISAVTAKYLIDAGKETWLTKRKDAVHAKGKGIMETYFANPKVASSRSDGNSSDAESTSEVQKGFPSVNNETHEPSFKKVNQRLVDWMTDLLLDHTKKVVCSRKYSNLKASTIAPAYHVPEGMTCMDEVKDVITMPTYNTRLAEINEKYRATKISQEVTENLRAYVYRIASGYRDNPFHSFEHACHVTMSVSKCEFHAMGIWCGFSLNCIVIVLTLSLFCYFSTQAYRGPRVVGRAVANHGSGRRFGVSFARLHPRHWNRSIVGLCLDDFGADS